MRSRLAITTMLVVGLLMSMAGGALAIEGTDSAAESQYPTLSTQSTGDGQVLGGQATGSQTDASAAADQARTLDDSAGGTLAFTGFAAIPLLLVGVALMVGGMVMRRQTRAPGAQS